MTEIEGFYGPGARHRRNGYLDSRVPFADDHRLPAAWRIALSSKYRQMALRID
jgi:hypothetical protein